MRNLKTVLSKWQILAFFRLTLLVANYEVDEELAGKLGTFYRNNLVVVMCNLSVLNMLWCFNRAS